MKILKIILYVVIGLVAVYLVMCLAGPKEMHASRTMMMHASPATVYAQVADYHTWKDWSKWQRMDPNVQVTITGDPGTVGHKQAWKSKKMGNGEQEITELQPNQFIKSQLIFEGFGTHEADMKFEEKGDSTLVTWNFNGSETPFMWRGMMLAMGGNASFEKDFDEGLTSLRKLVEAMPAAPAFHYDVVDIPEVIFVGKTKHVKEGEIDSALFANTYGELGKIIGGMDKIAGMPFSIGHNYDQKTGEMDLEIALPVAKQMKVPAGFNCSTIPAGKCAKYIYTGPYEKTGEAWNPFMTGVMKDHKTRYDGYEVYANDPSTVKSPNEYITWLIIPIE